MDELVNIFDICTIHNNYIELQDAIKKSEKCFTFNDKTILVKESRIRYMIYKKYITEWNDMYNIIYDINIFLNDIYKLDYINVTLNSFKYIDTQFKLMKIIDSKLFNFLKN